MDIFDFYDKTNLKSYNLDKTMQYQLNMLDSLDVFTRRHSENVADLTCRICEYLHCNKDFTEYATICAYLHDIGKLFISPKILKKKEPLTEEEIEQLKKHPALGFNVCKNDKSLRPYSAGALYHHECLDGSGYPNGYTKKDIPFEAQIIRVANEYDNLINTKQYKSHIGVSETLKEFVSKPNFSLKKVPESHALETLAQSTQSGKNNPLVVKALFNVVIDNIEYEIYCGNNYLSDLKQDLKRCEEIEKYRTKMLSSKNEKDKNYYLEGIKILLKPTETLENFDTICNDFITSFDNRKKIIDNLHNEIKIIKQLRKSI